MPSGEPESVQLLQGPEAKPDHEVGQKSLNEETMRSKKMAGWVKRMLTEELR